MFIDLERGQAKMTYCALKQPNSQRAHWFIKLRAYMRFRVPLTYGTVESDLDAILDLITQTEEALK